MASPTQLAKCFAILQSAFPKDLTPTQYEAYRMALDDITDDQLEFATGRALKACKFFPAPSELREFCGGARPALDVDRLCDTIQSLGQYHPHGFQFPRVEAVRNALGDAVANAYASAGASRVFTEDETGRSIARREMAKALELAPPNAVAGFLVGGKPERLALPHATRPALTAKAGYLGEEDPRKVFEKVAELRNAFREKNKPAA